jgi:hypothetical protein
MSWYSIVILLLGYVCLSLNIECGTKFFAPFCFFIPIGCGDLAMVGLDST